MIESLLAILPEPSVINLLVGGYTAMTAGFVALYRDTRRSYLDCRKDREQQWERIRQLEDRLDRLNN